MFVSLDTLADLLDLNRKTVYTAARRGMIPGVRRIGRAFRAHVPTVIEWFSAGPRTDRKRGNP
ncbi:MAG: DNA-binding protein [Proteobacteria bacterium]|nr:DNA-binding protein [Pseudomonadota bacterium]